MLAIGGALLINSWSSPPPLEADEPGSNSPPSGPEQAIVSAPPTPVLTTPPPPPDPTGDPQKPPTKTTPKKSVTPKKSDGADTKKTPPGPLDPPVKNPDKAKPAEISPNNSARINSQLQAAGLKICNSGNVMSVVVSVCLKTTRKIDVQYIATDYGVAASCIVERSKSVLLGVVMNPWEDACGKFRVHVGK